MTEGDVSTGGQGFERSSPPFWLTDLRGYWRDEVLKDLVKYAVQVSAALYVAVMLQLLPPGDLRIQIALVLAATLYIGAAVGFVAVIWHFGSNSGAVVFWVNVAVWSGLLLMVRAGANVRWIWWIWVLAGAFVILNLLLEAAVSTAKAIKSGGWRSGTRTLALKVVYLALMAAGGAAFAWLLARLH